MEDPDDASARRHNLDDEQRRAEAAMEEFLRAQEEEEGRAAAANNDNDGGDGDDDNVDPHDFVPDPQWMEREQQEQHQALFQPPQTHKPFRLSYVSTSFLVAFAMMYYALRTRQQWYLALVYLSSSKWAYIVLGNALVATLVSIFSLVTNVFLNGLRMHEAEGLGDFFRWNITETCLALTMFRSELTVQTGILFLVLVLAKSLHWVAELREQHLRMTQEAVVVHQTTGWPGLQWPHLKLFMCLMILQLFDVLAVMQCGSDIMKHGPSVSILFAFEGGILLVSVMSSILLWNLHVLDGIFHYTHETTQPGQLFHNWIHPWKDYKATLVFAVEVQAQAAKFFFYVTFFAIVMTYYGLPINLFREVYMSFQALKQRLLAFGKYRQLMASMNRFENPTEEELEEAGSTCIICRDEMTVVTTKRLPGCGHLFHKSCLRDWLVQQQSCPTCRGDITAMQERERQREAATERQRQQNEEQQLEQEQDGEEAEESATSNNGETGEDESVSTNDQAERPRLKDPPSYDTSLAPTKSAIKKEARFGEFSGSLLEDRKPAAATSHPATREKHVRILPPHHHAADSDPLRNEKPAFPAFYRVIQDEGASVYNNGETVSFVIRVVPLSVIILGLELSWRSSGEDGESRLMVRMPDGWVRDSDLERITAVPL